MTRIPLQASDLRGRFRKYATLLVEISGRARSPSSRASMLSVALNGFGKPIHSFSSMKFRTISPKPYMPDVAHLKGGGKLVRFHMSGERKICEEKAGCPALPVGHPSSFWMEPHSQPAGGRWRGKRPSQRTVVPDYSQNACPRHAAYC